MNDQFQSEKDLTDLVQLSQDSVSSYQLSQDSNLSQDFTSELLEGESVNESEKKVRKKKTGIKKVRKKKGEKVDDETGESADKPKKKKKKIKITKRPEPEGGNAPQHTCNPMTEFDRVIYSNEPLFSDVELSDNETSNDVPERPTRTPRPGGVMIPCLQLGMHSNTMIKFAIIGSEIQNLLRVSLIRHEQEIQSLTRKISMLEEDIMKSEERYTTAAGKLEEASKAADESERGRRQLEFRTSTDEENLDRLERNLHDFKITAEENEKKYNEAARKLIVAETELERTEEKYEHMRRQVKTLEDELHIATNNLRGLEIGEEKASQREDSYEETIRDLTNRLKDAENRATEAERTVSKLQKEVDRLEDELLTEKEKYKAISDELDATFAELAGY
ncbi:tropomyosin isoform X10 [Mytilus californianus]|uniref:tropomyosin isoform X10 n=1 Tax=Mytilus californianus TaxID=6549 RepID=UPI002247001D|nr:tropomyosin isoform X10 [Mytilus californianus]